MCTTIEIALLWRLQPLQLLTTGLLVWVPFRHLFIHLTTVVRFNVRSQMDADITQKISPEG